MPLKRPLRADQLAGYPHYPLAAKTKLYRSHTYPEPWWFATGTGRQDEGRFDLPAPNGTCYVAEEDLGAFVEGLQRKFHRFRATGRLFIRMDVVLSRFMSELYVPGPIRLADTTVDSAASFGITRAIESASNRATTQGWARAFAGAGFGGIRYRVQHAPGQDRIGIALFNVAGLASWPVHKTGPITAGVIKDAYDIFGIEVR